jgi:hypothetical protein
MAALQEASRERMERGAGSPREERLTLVAGPVRELELFVKNSAARLTAAVTGPVVIGPVATVMAMIARASR